MPVMRVVLFFSLSLSLSPTVSLSVYLFFSRRSTDFLCFFWVFGVYVLQFMWIEIFVCQIQFIKLCWNIQMAKWHWNEIWFCGDNMTLTHECQFWYNPHRGKGTTTKKHENKSIGCACPSILYWIWRISIATPYVFLINNCAWAMDSWRDSVDISAVAL